MPFDYIGVEDAIAREGLRMMVVGGVPSPWGEAAKGIFHIKGLEWAAVRLDYESEPLKQWAGTRSAPVAVYNKERPRSGWAEILLLAERLAPATRLIPEDAFERALAFGLAHEICGEGGLGWSRRLQSVHKSLTGGDGFPEPVAKYLARKYGYLAEAGETYGRRVADILTMLSARLKAQQKDGSAFYIGNALSAVDVYSAAFIALFAPLPPEQCDMNPAIRQSYETLDPETQAALDPILIEHRDRMYAEYLETPLSL